MEREHERDEFQQEIHRLEAQLKHTANVENKGHRVRDFLLKGYVDLKYFHENITISYLTHQAVVYEVL